MSLTKILARQCQFDLNTGTIAVPVWTPILSVDNFSPSPQKNDADTTTFDDDGVMTHLPASRDLSFTLSGKIAYTDADRTTRDPGQQAALAWAAEIGPEGLKQFRITYPDADESTDVFLASASVTNGGGGNDDPNVFSIEVHRSGATDSSDLGVAPSTPGTPTGVAGDDLVTVTWTGSAGTGGHFEVVAFAGSTEHSRRLTSTSPYTYNGLATATAYTFKVRAVSATGRTSEFSAASAAITTT